MQRCKYFWLLVVATEKSTHVGAKKHLIWRILPSFYAERNIEAKHESEVLELQNQLI